MALGYGFGFHIFMYIAVYAAQELLFCCIILLLVSWMFLHLGFRIVNYDTTAVLDRIACIYRIPCHEI